MISIQLDSNVPLAEQIEEGIRHAIASRAVKPGDPLPRVRQLAADLGVNLNTVARAYRALEARGLVSTVRGRGTVVRNSSEAPRLPREELRGRIAAAVSKVLADARLAGLGRQEMQALFKAEMAAFWQEE